ncbi:hypothetical protein [Pelolinea submarina]|uniref:Uncharacterized protein n=1 Tax=Pelolinea submarina TaxID=913107 RepID=A0A347ZU58_9CHLR|nr:hypothetical protein [Pelolinea submarina]REG10578.1 hypothetical protein DFR64_0437 [Pelolinea submarina]BBB48839.1 hypothetical protein Pelsub_P2070 [Pelolinea submarina]
MKSSITFLPKTMKELMMLFGVTLAKRYTRTQKRIFYSQAEPLFKELGFLFEFQKSRNRLSQITNIIIGNLAKAQYVVLCPYDTPAKSLLPYRYYPFNWSENARQENREIFLQTIFYIGVCALIYFVAAQFSVLAMWQKIISIAVLSALLIFSYKLIIGIANPINFNRNSASLALLFSLAQHTRQSKKVAYVLLDKNTGNNAGLKLLAESQRVKDQKLIFLDCLANGKETVCAHEPASSTEAQKLIAALPQIKFIDHQFEDKDRMKDTNLQIFPNMLHLCVGEVENRKFLVRNTRSKNDFKVDIPRLEILREGLIKYLEG